MDDAHKKTPKVPTNVVSFQKGFPTKPKTLNPDQFLKSVESVVDFELAHQRKQFESFETVVTNLASLNGSGVMRFKQNETTEEDSTNISSLDQFRKASGSKT